MVKWYAALFPLLESTHPIWNLVSIISQLKKSVKELNRLDKVTRSIVKKKTGYLKYVIYKKRLGDSTIFITCPVKWKTAFTYFAAYVSSLNCGRNWFVFLYRNTRTRYCCFRVLSGGSNKVREQLFLNRVVDGSNPSANIYFPCFFGIRYIPDTEFNFQVTYF